MATGTLLLLYAALSIIALVVLIARYRLNPFITITLVSLGLGIGGLVQKERKKIFAILGTIFSATITLGTVALIALAGSVDVVLVGTGADIGPIPVALRRAVEAAGIGVEIMATPSACRTYNVLLAEGRRIAAAVLAV